MTAFSLPLAAAALALLASPQPCPAAAAAAEPAAGPAAAAAPEAPETAATGATSAETPAFPWSETIPPEVAACALTPDRVLDERPCDWRPVLAPLFRPLVENCATAREATLALASRIGETTGVIYSRERRHPCMNALEALEEKKVSCTGQSILLACALRSVGIPARAVGVRTWNHVAGNHTWVEAWFEGGWHMIEFNEKDFNTPWVMEAIGMLDPARSTQRVLAARPGGALRFPTVWSLWGKVDAEDVTDRYLALAREWYATSGVPADCQRLMVDVLPRPADPRPVLLENEAGEELARATLPVATDDFRKFATLLLPREGACYLRLEGQDRRIPVSPTPAAVQLLRLRQAD